MSIADLLILLVVPSTNNSRLLVFNMATQAVPCQSHFQNPSARKATMRSTSPLTSFFFELSLSLHSDNIELVSDNALCQQQPRAPTRPSITHGSNNCDATRWDSDRSLNSPKCSSSSMMMPRAPIRRAAVKDDDVAPVQACSVAPKKPHRSRSDDGTLFGELFLSKTASSTPVCLSLARKEISSTYFTAIQSTPGVMRLQQDCFV